MKDGCADLLGIVIASAIMGLLVMFAWNLVIPIFWATAPTLNYLQSVGVWIIIRIIAGIFK